MKKILLGSVFVLLAGCGPPPWRLESRPENGVRWETVETFSDRATCELVMANRMKQMEGVFPFQFRCVKNEPVIMWTLETQLENEVTWGAVETFSEHTMCEEVAANWTERDHGAAKWRCVKKEPR